MSRVVDEEAPLLGQRAIEHLEICFVDCILTWTNTLVSSGNIPSNPCENSNPPTTREPKIGLADKLKNQAEKFTRNFGKAYKGEAISRRYELCTFGTNDDKIRIQNYISSLGIADQLKCNFIKRELSLCEKLSFWFFTSFCGGPNFVLQFQSGGSHNAMVSEETMEITSLQKISEGIIARLQQPE